jgi:histidinol dehydrogenase
VNIERIEWDGLDPRALAARLRAIAPRPPQLRSEVAAILDRVREGGDDAIRELAGELGDEVPERLRVDPEAVAAAPGLLEPEIRDALRLAASNIDAVARAELAAAPPATCELPQGHRVEVRSEPVASAGVYAPGGRAAYPSSVLMCCLAARAAGVARIAVATPPGRTGRPSAATLAACALAGVEEVYAVGGAQAIAALAFGTAAIPAVEVVVGPGNPYVAEAKRQVAGIVGIDGIAGPSELFVVADRLATPEWLALDLAAQAEHGPDSPLVAASPEPALLDAVADQVEALAAERPTIAEAPLALVAAPGIEASLALADAFAPEHLELAFAGADEIVARARVAGAVFVGSRAATAFGDYAAGSNHVLPTGGAARFGGPLGVGTFRRRTSVVTISRSAAAALAPVVAAIADAEGLPVHGQSALARAGENGQGP